MEVKLMKIIGLTGGSGTGKGTVAARMRALGAGWVDADAVYRTLCAENREMLSALDTAFGGVTDANGVLDRPKLAKIVFSDPAKLQQLNEITTPYIRKASLDAIHAQSECPIVLYDAPTLFEAGADDFCDKIIAVLAPHDTRVARIIERDGLFLFIPDFQQGTQVLGHGGHIDPVQDVGGVGPVPPKVAG